MPKDFQTHKQQNRPRAERQNVLTPNLSFVYTFQRQMFGLEPLMATQDASVVANVMHRKPE